MTGDGKDIAKIVSLVRETQMAVDKACNEVNSNNPINIESLFFGDSIVLFIWGDDSAKWFVFPFAVGIFQQMFQKGMPARGAISKGRFCKNGGIYAGPPLNEAVELSGRLEFAGCVVAPSAENWWNAERAEHQLLGLEAGDFKLLNVPLKPLQRCSCAEMQREYKTVLVLTHKLDVSPDAVRVAFERNGKKIEGSVVNKLENTIQVLLETRKT